MKSTITLNRILYCLLSFFLLIPIFLVSNLNALAILTLIQFFICLVFIHSIYKKVLTLPFFLLVAIYLFHFGQLIVVLFGCKNLIANGMNVLDYLDNDVYVRSIRFASSCLFAFSLGVSYLKKKNNANSLPNCDKNIQLANLRILGLFLFAFSFPCRFYIDINKLILYLSGSYIDTYNLSINGVFNILSLFLTPSLMLLIISYHQSKIKCRTVIIFAIVYSLFSMLKGNRAQELITIISALYLYTNIRKTKQIDFKKMFFLFVGTYLLIVIMNLVGNARLHGNLISFENLLLALEESNPINQMMRFFGEMGGTMKSLGYAIKYVPSYNSYVFGFTYVVSLCAIYPNIGGLLGNIPNYYSFLNFFPSDVTKYMGGSILGELYVNFGFVFGVIVCFVVGYFVGRINNSFIESCEKKNNYYKLAIISILIPNLILWSRDFFVTLVFETFWVGILICLMKYLRKGRINE